MNNFINWLAVNNTLMIRIGFTAILGLLVVYVFRYFFVPKVTLVNENESGSERTIKATSIDEADLEKRRMVEEKQAQYYASEIEKHLIENARLKDQLMDSNTLVTELKEKNQALSDVNQALGEAASTPTPADPKVAGTESDPEFVSELKNKVSSLESRLSEYEIIAEDISEIGQLRKENADLRKKLSAEPEPNAESLPEDELIAAEINPEIQDIPIAESEVVALVVAEPVNEQIESVEVQPEATIEEPQVDWTNLSTESASEFVETAFATKETPASSDSSDATLDELMAAIESPKPEIESEPTPESNLVKVSNVKEVSSSEREMIDHFEETTRKKESS